MQAYYYLSRDIAIFNRSFSNKNKLKYSQVELFVTQIYRARVLALFLDAIRDVGYLQDTNSSKLQDNKAVAIIISRLSPA
jgi:hypothetical protein